MDLFLDFASLLPNVKGDQGPPPWVSSAALSSEFAEIPVDSERAGAGISSNFCVVS
jgi:hypothetical protein